MGQPLYPQSNLLELDWDPWASWATAGIYIYALTTMHGSLLSVDVADGEIIDLW